MPDGGEGQAKMKKNALTFTQVLREFGIRRVKGSSTATVAGNLTVDDPMKLAAYGFRGVKRGDRVKVVNLGRGKWSVEHLSTGKSVTRNIGDILAARGGPAFGPIR